MFPKDLFCKGVQLFNKNSFRVISDLRSSLSTLPTLHTKLLCINNQNEILKKQNPIFQLNSHKFSTSQSQFSLMEFFDDEKNWTEPKVTHGRPWHVGDLRLKSNVQLHKLWYVLHKERNMLLTMEAAFKNESQPFPSPERITKVNDLFLSQTK